MRRTSEVALSTHGVLSSINFPNLTRPREPASLVYLPFPFLFGITKGTYPSYPALLCISGSFVRRQSSFRSSFKPSLARTLPLLAAEHGQQKQQKQQNQQLTPLS